MTCACPPCRYAADSDIDPNYCWRCDPADSIAYPCVHCSVCGTNAQGFTPRGRTLHSQRHPEETVEFVRGVDQPLRASRAYARSFADAEASYERFAG